MTQRTSPFLGAKYGWDYGESGWNGGMDENLLQFSFMFDKNIDGIVSSLPAVVNGTAYFLTTDNRIYFGVSNSWYSTPTPKWFTLFLRASGESYQFNGTSLIPVASNTDLSSQVQAIQVTLSSLGTASLEDVDYFASAAQLDVASAQANNYTDQLRRDLFEKTDPTKGASLWGYKGRDGYQKLGESLSVRDYITTTIDGTTSNQVGIEAAVTDAYNKGASLYWPSGTYVSTSNIPNFHLVEHEGSGVLKRNSSIFHFSQYGNQTNQLFMSPTGTGDGLSVTEPIGGIQNTIDFIAKRGKLFGRWQLVGSGGSYLESVSIPDGLAQSANYLEFKFPSTPGIRTDPSLWPVGGAVLDATGLNPLIAFNIGRYNKVSIEYLLVKGSFNSSLAATSQVSRGISVDKYSFLLTQGVSYSDNGLSNLNILPEGAGSVTGGWMRGARYSIDNTGGSLSLSASPTTYTVVQGGLEYGLYQKHDSRTVMDYTEFSDCGLVVGASAYGSAIFSYRSNSSTDTRGCKFYRNNIVFNIRGGSYAANPGIPDIFGSGADANIREYRRSGYGSIDLESYQATSQLNITRNFGGGSTTGTTTVLVYNSLSTLSKARFMASDQGLEIVVYASNNSGGTASVRPSLVTAGGARYELGNFQVAASTNAAIVLDVVVSSNGTVASVYYRNIGATLGGTTTGQIIINPLPFATEDLTFQVWGDTSSTNTLTIRRSYIRTEG